MSRRWRYRIIGAIVFVLGAVLIGLLLTPTAGFTAECIDACGGEPAGWLVGLAYGVYTLVGGWVGDLLWRLDVADANERARLRSSADGG